jgi:hypothetical protein
MEQKQWDGNRSGLLWSAPGARRHSRRAWIEIRLEMMEHETLWGLFDGGSVSMLHALHGGYIWVQGKVEPLAGI